MILSSASMKLYVHEGSFNDLLWNTLDLILEKMNHVDVYFKDIFFILKYHIYYHKSRITKLRELLCASILNSYFRYLL